MKLDILAIGAHPDDVELGCGGTLMKHVALGQKVGILDLTQGEMGTRGTPEQRLQEAQDAAKILGVQVRENAGFRDGFFRNDEEHQLALIKYIRKYQPDIVLANAIQDRHPDHGRAAKLVYDAVFLSGLRRIETGQEAWRPNAYYNYVQFIYIEPDFVVDVTEYHEKKMKAIWAHKSQFFNPDSNEPETFISSPDFMNFQMARYADFGKMIGAQYAEGFTTNRYMGVRDLSVLS